MQIGRLRRICPAPNTSKYPEHLNDSAGNKRKNRQKPHQTEHSSRQTPPPKIKRLVGSQIDVQSESLGSDALKQRPHRPQLRPVSHAAIEQQTCVRCKRNTLQVKCAQLRKILRLFPIASSSCLQVLRFFRQGRDIKLRREYQKICRHSRR